MIKGTENLKKSPEKTILDLKEELELAKAELASYKEKYARLIEEILLAKQHRFAPGSEKNILQPDLFDEPGVELSLEVKEALEHETLDITRLFTSRNYHV